MQKVQLLPLDNKSKFKSRYGGNLYNTDHSFHHHCASNNEHSKGPGATQSCKNINLANYVKLTQNKYIDNEKAINIITMKDSKSRIYRKQSLNNISNSKEQFLKFPQLNIN